MPKKPSNEQGFSLIELMAVVALVAILTAIAAPSFTSTIRENRNVVAANTIMQTLSIGRSEAIRLGREVTVCPSKDGSTCSADWAEGLIVILDTAVGTAAPVKDTSKIPATGILKVEGALLNAKVTQTAGGAQQWVRYSSRGIPTGKIEIKLQVKPVTCTAGKEYYRELTVSVVGKVTATKTKC